MRRIKISYSIAGVIALFAVLMVGWQLLADDGYESAAYTVVESDGKMEVRQYPELTLATTQMKSYGQGRDGSFMRLFGYISGQNESKQKIAMTTPVFMDASSEKHEGQMAFVLPKKVAADSVPDPANEEVAISKRAAGKYAVVRFSGRMDRESIEDAEKRLREWLDEKGLAAAKDFEFAGYDPPWTPGPLRRNEVLIRLDD